jgi:hypothetical protein
MRFMELKPNIILPDAHSAPRSARAAISQWALINSYGFIGSLAIIFLAVQLPKVNVSLFGFVAGSLE